ncbi:zinc finger MYM-type protein 1-like [Odontesthes bonariensis]|uniref:zinc finger MYM-type protein 1-like n=1 Tax=Odontesthes bonariensis TaxID=219752 RepID=UPI003F58EB9F
MSGSIQNEILELFAHDIQRKIGAKASESPFFGLTADGITDVSGKEQFSCSIQFADNNLEVQNFFLGFYNAPGTTAEMLFLCIKDVLVRLNLPLEKLKGYCFDGASNMSGRFKGVQARLKETCPDSVFVHCANHSLDLVLQEVAKEERLVADTLNFVREVTVVINDSAKRKTLYQSLFGCGEVINLLALCPTRWCVRVVALSRLLACYGEMLQTFRTLEGDRTVKGETRAKVAGLLKKGTTTRTVFGLFACVTMFTPCESVARSLQGTKVTALGSMEAAKLLCQRLNTLRQDDTFADLVAKTKQYAERYNLKPPHPVRTSKTPARFRHTAEEEERELENEEYPSLWKRELFEALDLVRTEVERRFDQEGLRVAAGREQAVLQAAQGKRVDVGSLELTSFSREQLSLELDILSDVCRGREVKTIQDVLAILHTLQPHSMLPEAERLIKLCLALPISVAASERSLSALRRLKTWLRNTMKQERLTHLAIMNAHSDLLDECDVSTLLKEFISRTTERRSTFGKV